MAYPGSLFPVTAGTFSMGLLENLEESLEKKEDRAAGLIDDVS